MSQHFDVVIVGAGLSGIGAAYHLKTHAPDKSFTILEGRATTGGTWDLFRYPGVRSDSDMFTLGYAFRPWAGENAIVDGAAVLAYIRKTAADAGLDRAVRCHHEVVRATWSSRDAIWTLDIRREGEMVAFTCRFLFLCAGYYDYGSGHRPEFPGFSDFGGTYVHPQFWPADLDCKSKRVVVIGSGATAITLVPALAEDGAHVTMLQRSPSYVVSLPTTDGFMRWMRRLLPARLGYKVVRWRNILLSVVLYSFARRRPEQARRWILNAARRRLGPACDVETHFNPGYNPWDQRVCVAPDGDLFKAIRCGKAEIVTDEIDTFTRAGVLLRSGRELQADVVVTATGLKLKLVGGIEVVVDGQKIDLSQSMTYNGCMFSDVPNFVFALGYINASWTLKCDLVSIWVTRLLSHMDRRGFSTCIARADPSVIKVPLIDFTSGYIQRAIDRLPKQGDRKPWHADQNYLLDTLAFKLKSVDDGTLFFR